MPDRADPRDGEALIVERLAVMLTAGITPAVAWQYLAEESQSAGRSRLGGRRWTPAVLTGVANGYTRGRNAADSLRVLAPRVPLPLRDTWMALAATWSVASAAGSPLGPALTALAEEIRFSADLSRDAEVALASVRSSTRLMLTLPVIGVLLAQVSGVDSLGFLLGGWPGAACLVGAVTLLFIARAWTRQLSLTARSRVEFPGLPFQLVMLGLTGGWSVARSRQSATDALHEFLSHPGRSIAAVDGALRLAARTGASVTALLRAEQGGIRRAAMAETRSRVSALSVRALVPLGVCVLPAFLLSSVLPMVASLVLSASDALG